MATRRKTAQGSGGVRAAIYCRVSTDPQERDGTSLDNQEATCRAYAEERGWNVVMVRRDTASGYKLTHRPGLQAIRDAFDDELDLLLCYSMDRLSRKQGHVALLLEEMGESGVQLDFATEDFDPDDEDAELMLGFRAYSAQKERRKIAQRTMTGKLGSVEEGFYIRTALTPYGYKATRALKPGSTSKYRTTLEADPKTARVIRRIYKLASEGHGIASIAATLTKDRVPTPLEDNPKRRGEHQTTAGVLKWSGGTVSKFIRNPRYRGAATFKGQPMQCPALVPDAVWFAANEAMTNRASHHGRRPKHFALLRGRVRCRRCGSTYTFESTTRRNSRSGEPLGGYRQEYLCYRRRRHGEDVSHDGVQWRWKADDLEARVKEGLTAMFDDPERLQREIEVWADEWATHAAELPARVAALDAQIEDIERQRARLTDLLLRDMLPESEVLANRARLDDEQRRLVEERKREANEARTVEQRALMARIVAESVLEFAPGVYDERIGERVEPDWSAMLRDLVSEIWVEDDSSITLEGSVGVRNVRILPGKPRYSAPQR